MTATPTLEQRFDEVVGRIRRAEIAFHRPTASVQLVAVSKTHAATRIRRVAALGHRDFGENYLQEALHKMDELADLDLRWHFIGHLQSNKCRDAAARFDWIHSVDRLKIARRLSTLRPDGLRPLQLMLQVNLQNEPSKSGLSVPDVAAVAEEVAALPRIQLRGLMAIPALTPSFDEQRAVFSELRELMQNIQASGIPLDCLSMGMTGDLEAAIAEGATHVRVGTAIFGPRDYDNLADPRDTSDS